MEKKFYHIIQPVVKFLFYVCYRPTVIGKENIPKNTAFVLAGNHTKWLDPIMLIAVVPKEIHFLAKEELFHGITKGIVKGMGCIPVNRKIHDKNVLQQATKELEKNQIIGIFPEGTINRTNQLILPFKIGAVKMSKDSNCPLVPFVITGKYHMLRKRIQLEFLPPQKIQKDLEKENQNLMNKISKKLEEYHEYNK